MEKHKDREHDRPTIKSPLELVYDFYRLGDGGTQEVTNTPCLLGGRRRRVKRSG